MKNKIINSAKITFDSKSVNEGFARVSVCSFFANIDPTVEEITDIKTAVSEAVTNAIVHAYQDTLGKIIIDLKLYDNNTAEIKITDKGCGIQDIKQAMEPLFTTKPEEERAGLGFAVMQSFMDNVKVKSKIGQGSIITLTKKITTKDNI